MKTVDYGKTSACINGSSQPQQTRPIAQKQTALGYSMIEIMISVAVLGVLSGVAAPSFAGFISKSNVRATSAELTNTLNLARSAAISHGKTVIVCPVSGLNSAECGSSKGFNASWKNGWKAYVDMNLNNELDETDLTLMQTGKLESTNVIFNQRGRLRFFADGSARSAGFYICAQNTSEFRHVKLLHSGRNRTSSEGSQKHKKHCQY